MIDITHATDIILISSFFQTNTPQDDTPAPTTITPSTAAPSAVPFPLIRVVAATSNAAVNQEHVKVFNNSVSAAVVAAQKLSVQQQQIAGAAGASGSGGEHLFVLLVVI